MSIRNYKKIVSVSAPAITALGLHHIFNKKYSGKGHILMFHRVIPKTEAFRVHNHESLEISPEHLEQIILYFKRRNYLFISINDLRHHLKGNSKRKFVAFTFDDGYLDNLTYAYPIFKKYAVPLTIYITTNFINAKAIMWWYHLEQTLLKKDLWTFTWTDKQYTFECNTRSQKEFAFDEVRKLITSSFSSQDHLKKLSCLFETDTEVLLDYTKDNAMTWQQISDLSKDPLVTIGAHTANHLPLTNLDSTQLHAEIVKSKLEIEDRIGKKVDHFAYPFGKSIEAGEREYEFVKTHQFSTAVTTNIGNIFEEHINHLHKLPRININSLTNKDVLDLQVSGLVSFFKNGKNKLVK